jgi:hypothetical protein
MAVYLSLDKSQYLEGLIPLFRGDDWLLTGKIVNQLPQNYFGYVDLAGVSATAYFPTDPTLNLVPVQPAVVQFTNVLEGEFTINLPASASISTLLTPNGSSIYMETKSASGLTTTYQTNDSPLQIQDRTFLQF